MTLPAAPCPLLTDVDARIARALASIALGKHERALLRTLSENHRGAANALNAKGLAAVLGLVWSEGTRRKITDCIATLRHAPYRIPIGASRGERERKDSIRKGQPQGYFLIVNPRELAQFNNVNREQATTTIELLAELNSAAYVREWLEAVMRSLESRQPGVAA